MGDVIKFPGRNRRPGGYGYTWSAVAADPGDRPTPEQIREHYNRMNADGAAKARQAKARDGTRYDDLRLVDGEWVPRSGRSHPTEDHITNTRD
jgi:hypothetical protein